MNYAVVSVQKTKKQLSVEHLIMKPPYTIHLSQRRPKGIRHLPDEWLLNKDRVVETHNQLPTDIAPCSVEDAYSFVCNRERKYAYNLFRTLTIIS